MFMFLPDVSLKVKLIGFLVLAVLTVSLIATALVAVNQVLAEGSSQSQTSREQFANSLGNQNHASADDGAVLSGLKFVCPFH